MSKNRREVCKSQVVLGSLVFFANFFGSQAKAQLQERHGKCKDLTKHVWWPSHRMGDGEGGFSNGHRV